MAPRRIFFFDINGLRGGSAESLRVLLRHLDQTRYEAVLGFGARGNRARWPGFRVYEAACAGFDNYDFAPMRWNAPTIYGVLRWLARLPLDLWTATAWLRKERPDLVHINVGQALTFGFAARLLRIPIVWHIREMVCSGIPGRFQQAVYRLCARRMVAISAAVAARVPACSDRTEIVYNGVDARPADVGLAAAFRRTHGIATGRFAVLLLGNLQIDKGYLFLAEVADRMATDPRVAFVLAGDTEDPPAGRLHRCFRWIYRNLRRAPGDRERIRNRWQGAVARGQALFVGRVASDVAAAAADVVVCPNLTTEPFGRTVIEAYAQGRPVIATDVPAFPELIVDGETGWLLPPDAETWATRLRALAADPAAVERAGRNGRVRATAFDGAEHARRIMDLYDHVR